MVIIVMNWLFQDMYSQVNRLRNVKVLPCRHKRWSTMYKFNLHMYIIVVNNNIYKLYTYVYGKTFDNVFNFKFTYLTHYVFCQDVKMSNSLISNIYIQHYSDLEFQLQFHLSEAISTRSFNIHLYMFNGTKATWIL